MNGIGLWQIVETGPARLQAAELAMERDLEDWIERDPALLERGLVIVGRQIRLESGPLDLLALDPQGRWVLIEIKRERLRREVIAQAIDYASCLHCLDVAQLRAQCDAYLRSRGGDATLDALLEQRGRSVEAEADGRDVVIYLVGTGFDPALGRMLNYLAEQADLSVRMVAFSAFRDAQDRMLLSRAIHENSDDPAAVGRQQSRPSPAPETLLALADQNGVGNVVRTLYGAAMNLGLHARFWAKSIMFAPPANRSRCLFVVWVERRQREPGLARVFISAEAFEQFYGIKEAALAEAVGQVDQRVMLDQSAAERVVAGLQRLMAGKIAE